MYCKKPFDIRKRVCRLCKNVSECQTERLMKAIFGNEYKLKRTKVAKNDSRKSNTGNK